MTTARRKGILVILLGLVGLAIMLAVPAAASAGRYQVTDLTRAAWEPIQPGSSPVVGENFGPRIGATDPASNGARAFWKFAAPPNSAVVSAELDLDHVYAAGGWEVYVRATRGDDPMVSDYIWRANDVQGGRDTVFVPRGATNGSIFVALECQKGSCPGGWKNGHVWLRNAKADVENMTPPSVALTANGTAGSNRWWVGGRRTLGVNASDDVGVRRLSVSTSAGKELGGTDLRCAWGTRIPCPTSSSGTLVDIDFRSLPDGEHDLVGQATDSAGNVAKTPSRKYLVDNTPPREPQNLALEGGPGWRQQNAFSLRWETTQDQFAPVNKADYLLCRVDGAKECEKRAFVKDGVNALENIQVPAPGNWEARVALTDQANNSSEYKTVGGLGYDETPPLVSVRERDRNDPARVAADASDPDSGIRGGVLEIRRARGRGGWKPAGQMTAGQHGLSARLPDGRFQAGNYRVRVKVRNNAGLEAVAAVPRQVRFPIRRRSSLTASKRRSPRIGQRITLRGRLRIGRKAGSGEPLEIYTRTALEDAKWQRQGVVRTNQTGRYRVRLGRGPARTVRLIYPGTERIADVRRDVHVQVRSTVRLRIDKARVRNRDTITLSGRVSGGKMPRSGVQLAIQAFQRGKWRPFRTPTTDGRGRFKTRYQFETVLGRARFRFRAVVLKNHNYPYFGYSNISRVTVRGI